MSNVDRFVPSASYGLLDRTPEGSPADQAAEQVRHLGYALLDAGYAPAELRGISDAFESARKTYIETHGEARLRSLDEFYTVRSVLTQPAGKETFLALALNPNLMAVLKQLIQGKFILNQQNGIVNPPQEGYNQSAWHRDLPYQHFVSSRPLAINALFCVDDFTFDNGATFVLPASHKAEPFPSRSHVERNATQIEAKAGSFILLDCMMFHAGGFNKTNVARRAVNHVFNIPYFKQQINLPSNIDGANLSAEARDILGFGDVEPASVGAYLSSRESKKS
ncbi:phytanoyl-CoA dioxygenase family protein [Variovorax sp. PAMC26660]|uniref:phytanoyl-CoA dioxygenase family protein n=1 Tax=Variovorax sp. PAMC26660 TaxID=2762322 RepID=UPI00164D78ED|nr:phytanoyl-CoA dioxygenase family protein [Variovorax sp. PAMC26660]QNK71075.1 phytanoyl-CoA dioxygenase family protein [Variovorax sp. PAMC26660]